MWKWIGANRLLAATIAVLSLVAIASAVDGYRNRKEVRRLNAALGIQEKALLAAKEKELKEAEEAWTRTLNVSDAKLAPVLRERDTLKVKLARIEAQVAAPFVVPASDSDREARWEAAGYKVRVLR